MNSNNNQSKQYKTVNVNFSILKSAKKMFVMFYKNEQTLNDLKYKEFGYGKNRVEILKSGTQELDVFLTNDIIEFAIVQTNWYNRYTPIIFGTKPQKSSKDYSIFRMYSENKSDKKFFKTDKQYWFNIFRITEIAKEIVEKHEQFHELEDLADLLSEDEKEQEEKKEEKDKEKGEK